jgi:uncharacterized repeat protein (TIGR03803 family)
MNGKKRFTLRVSTVCIAITLGALVILSLVGVAHTVWAQKPAAESVIFNFRPATGYFPSFTIARDSAGNIYGTTINGANPSSCGNRSGCGTIFKISTTGQQTILHTFVSNDPFNGFGANGVIRDASGTLYGTTNSAGTVGQGTIFKLTSSGSYGVLHNFTGGTDGSVPSAVVVRDSAGNLYGTTGFGGGTGCSGEGCGTIYRVTPSGQETVLYSFTGGTDGSDPVAPLVLDSAGNFYGTAEFGGDLSCPLDSSGCGTVYKLDTSGNFTVLHTFAGGTDGAAPAAGLVMDSSGNLYGDAGSGGDLSCSPPDGCGTVFEINSSGNFSVLYTFVGGATDGQFPVATLFRDSAGNLYGTTAWGGDQSCSVFNSLGCGVVFKLASSGGETILHAFTGGTTDGALPQGALITGGNGTLYGSAPYGGTLNGGVLFAVRMY